MAKAHAAPRNIVPLRARLLLATTVVQLAMLLLLIYTSIGVMEEKLVEHTRSHVEEQKQLLSAALAMPVAQNDRRKVQEVIERARRDQAVTYLVLFDKKGKITEAAGWDRRQPLPPRDALLKARDPDGVFHTEVEVRLNGERHGKVALGVSTEFLKVARMQLIRDNLAIGVILLILSTGLMMGVGFWLTRNLTRLSAASAQLARGDLNVRVPVRGSDEVAQLTHAFNTMADSLSSRINALAETVAQREEAETQLELKVVQLKDSQHVQQEYLGRAQEEHARLSALLAAMDTGILFVSQDNRIVYSNPAFGRIWPLTSGIRVIGRTPEELVAASSALLAHPEEQSRHILAHPRPNEPGANFEINLADGRIVMQEGHEVRDIAGTRVGHLWVFRDITHDRQTAEQLIYLAERDALTGLYNRHRFNEELNRMIAEAQRQSSRLALLYFDMDDFKYINDTFGHRAGDAMLIRVAGELAGQVRRNELFCRLGGDEFGILVPDISEDMLRVLAERITRSIATMRFQFEGQSLRLTTSVGIAVYPDHADNAEDLIARADMAMYMAKEAGKNAWRVYRSDLDTSLMMVSHMSWNDRILHALENRLMSLQYQGIYSTVDKSLSHFEVLVRMRDKDDASRLLMPGQFIPMAEKSGKIVEIDRWVLRESIRMLAETKTIPALAVNISGRSFDEPTLPQYIAEQLKRWAVSPRRLLVELTETSAVSDLHDAQRFIEALRQTGCIVCLDDFGTGFSSFAYLKHLQADAVKIDGLFIRNLPQERDNQLFVKAIVSVAKGLHKTTIAECVEDAETLDMLRNFGVDCVQGYHLEKPHGDFPAIAARTRANLELRLGA